MSGGRSGLRRALRAAVKLAVVAAVAGLIVYQVRFAPVSVQALGAARGSVVAEVMGTGTLEARVRASISPKITGRLDQVLVDQSDRVAKGKLLATLDDADLRQQVEVADAELAAAKAGVDLAGAEIGRARATAVQARSAYVRTAQLEEKKLVSREDLDKAIEQRDVAEADLRRMELAKIESESLVAKAQASQRYAAERLADTKIAAPFDGLVVSRSRDPGDVVVPGSAILEIISTEEVWVSAWVDETAMAQLKPGQPARLVFRSRPDAPVPGHVARLAPQTDRETREFLVDVAVDKLPATWAVGQRAEAYIETGRSDGVLAIPQRVIVWRGGQSGVMVDRDGKAAWQKVSLGLRGRENVAVAEGLSEGDVVVTVPAGSELPRDGRAIRYEKP